MPAAITRRLIWAALMSSAVVFVLFVIYERPGLGIGHFLYISIALAAMAGGPALGALAGTVATALYVSGVLLNPRMPSHEILTAGDVHPPGDLRLHRCVDRLVRES